MAKKTIQNDLTRQRSKFKTNVTVRDVMVGNPDFTRKSLLNGAKLLVEDDTHEGRYNHLQSLEKEGQMFRNTSSDASEVWGKALMFSLDEERKFALNSAPDTLPHNVNLHLWRKRGDNIFPLCGELQTLIHVFNMCPVALTTRRYHHCHDAVLEVIANTISNHLQPTEHMYDLGLIRVPVPTTYIVPTILQPDIVC